jgi:hypothetical protein
MEAELASKILHSYNSETRGNVVNLYHHKSVLIYPRHMVLSLHALPMYKMYKVTSNSPKYNTIKF